MTSADKQAEGQPMQAGKLVASGECVQCALIQLIEICLSSPSQGLGGDFVRLTDDSFLTWLHNLGLPAGQLYGWPDFVVDWGSGSACGGCSHRKRDDENDQSC